LAASFGSSAAWIVFAIGLVLGSFGLVIEGIALLSSVVLFNLINLPVEFDARDRWVLLAPGQIRPEEDEVMARVQNALGWTYVANRPTSMLTLLYLLFRPGLLGGRRHESDRPHRCSGDRRIRG
jgi:Zn-dependent membrane protease YugP